MPDIWTKHPDIVKALLEEGGFQCGVEPRVLKPRDPNWTCIINGEKISGDLYIHPVSEMTEGKIHMGLASGWQLFLILLCAFMFVRIAKRRGYVRNTKS
jgi:hypothetical protein